MRRGGRRTRGWPAAVLAAALACAIVAVPAGARPDDLLIEAIGPGDGTVLKDASTGVRVIFTCPTYHTDDTQFVTKEGDGYHAILATAPDLGPDGLLLEANRVDESDARPAAGTPGRCTDLSDERGNLLLPKEPGVYFWQAYRDCAAYVCLGGSEKTEVRSVTVQRTICTLLRARLGATDRKLRQARASLADKPASRTRRSKVRRLSDKWSTTRSELTVVYGCALRGATT